jgi:hypothetical protein
VVDACSRENTLVPFVDGFSGARGEQIRQSMNPESELMCRDAGSASGTFAVFEDAEDLGGKELCNDSVHARKPGHEKLDGIAPVERKRPADTLTGVCPRIVVVQPVYSDEK